MRTARKTGVAILAAAALLVAAGVAYATIPDANGVIHACYARSGGNLRVIDASVTNCKSTETSLDWNVQGQPGLQGPAGPAGPQGPQGPSGLSHGYFATGNAVLLGFTYTPVASAGQLPDGAYVVWANASLATPAAATVSCELEVNGNTVTNSPASADAATGSATVAIASAVTLSGGASTVSLDCVSTVLATHAQTANLTLVPVDALD